MSLNYDLTQVKDKSIINDKAATWPLTEAIIFETMVVGIGDIKSEKEAIEFKVRSDYWRRLDNVSTFLPLEEIKKRIGLTTNVFPRVKTAAFLSRISSRWHREQVRTAKSAA